MAHQPPDRGGAHRAQPLHQARRKLWIRIFPDKPYSKKPAETRMGKGKGGPEVLGRRRQAGHDPLRVGRRRAQEVAEEAMRLAGSKLPVKTKFALRADRE
ncbi:MAG: ribosomal protein L16 [Bacillus subtilis]|nr:ribosomal protein L16 [Bacillus subtilis]